MIHFDGHCHIYVYGATNEIWQNSFEGEFFHVASYAVVLVFWQIQKWNDCIRGYLKNILLEWILSNLIGSPLSIQTVMKVNTVIYNKFT